MNALLVLGLIVTLLGLAWGVAVGRPEDAQEHEQEGCGASLLRMTAIWLLADWLKGARKDKKCLICVLVGIVMSAIGLVLEVWLRSVR